MSINTSQLRTRILLRKQIWEGPNLYRQPEFKRYRLPKTTAIIYDVTVEEASPKDVQPPHTHTPFFLSVKLNFCLKHLSHQILEASLQSTKEKMVSVSLISLFPRLCLHSGVLLPPC